MRKSCTGACDALVAWPLRWVLMLGLFAMTGTSASASERWPANVCKELADWETEQTQEWGSVLWLGAISRCDRDR